MTERLTREAIFAAYSDEPTFLDRFLKLQALSDFLNACVVDDKYEIPHRLASVIRLTGEGSALAKRLQSNANPRNYCLVALLLELWWRDLFVDPIETDIDGLRGAISEEIKKDRILLPFAYGRTLYDKAFEEYPDSREILSYNETLDLLRSTPRGVFQLDEYVSGPWGLLRSRAKRYAPPTRSIPLYHCNDFSCSAYHRTHLTTGRSRISKVSTRLHETLDKRREALSEWEEVLAEQVEKNVNPFSWQHSAGLPRFLGDAFSVGELRLILTDLLDNTTGKLREDLASEGHPVKDADGFAEQLDEAECLQAILLCEDRDVLDSIDSLVLSNTIEIPETEVRAPVTSYGGGYFRLQPECSKLGVRFEGTKDLALLRVRHLVATLFDLTNPTEAERLGWLIRMTGGGSFQDQLEGYLSKEGLDQVIRTIVFDSRKNLESAKHFVGLGPRAGIHLTTESELAESIGWRLGIGQASNDRPVRDFHSYGRELRDLVITTHDYSEDEQRGIRGVAANFFVKLEQLLTSYLKLATWALCRDHYGSSEGFVYSSAEAGVFCASILNNNESGMKYPDGGKWTLAPLCRGFAILAKVLGDLSARPDRTRPTEEAPLMLQRNSGPHSFLFNNRYPFLDLTETSRCSVIGLLTEASSKLEKGRVDYVRNQLQHDNPFPQQETMLSAIDAAEAVVAEAEEAGFLPIVARVLAEHSDSYGRRQVTIGTSRGKEAVLVRPSQHFLAGFPSLSSPQYVVRAAVFEGSSEPLRLGIVDESEYARRWRGFPRRRRVTLNQEADRTAAVSKA